MKNYQLDFVQSKKTVGILLEAIEQTADHIMITDVKGNIVYVNPAFERSTGYEQAEVLGKNPRILKSGKQTKEYYDKLYDTITKGKIFKAMTVNKKKNGELYVADQTVSSIVNEQGDITHYISVWKDKTVEQILEKRLVEERDKLEEILGFDEKVSSIRKFDALTDFVVDKICKILNVKKCSIMLLDKNSNELCIRGARGISDDVIKRSRIPVADSMAGQVAREGDPVIVYDIELDERFHEHNNPRYLGHSFMIVPIRIDCATFGVICVADKKGEGGSIVQFDEIDLRILCAISREVAVALENVQLYKKLNYLVVEDTVSHLYNFRYFSKTLDYEVKRAERYSRDLCLLMIDIDNFSSYNKSFGECEGNRALKDIGEILTTRLRDVDIVCRYYDDQFAVILPETNIADARKLSKAIQTDIERFAFKDRITVTMGVASYYKNMNRLELISKAECALSEAKKEGRNQICVLE